MELALPILFAVFLWWFSTGVIVYVDGLPKSTFGWTMIWSTTILVCALIGFAASTQMPTVEGAYLAFVCGLLCWAWQEVSFLTGHITGPRRSAQPDGAHGLQRLWLAIQTILYHEIAIVLMGIGLVWLAWGAPNTVGLWTYAILWIMRLSAKINVYLGVTNHAAEFLPDEVAYLQSYFGKHPMNLFFPLSVTVSTVFVVWLFTAATAAGATPFETVGTALLASLLALAVLEHWFLIIPLPATQLWAWGLVSHTSSRAKTASSTPTEINETKRSRSQRSAAPVPPPYPAG